MDKNKTKQKSCLQVAKFKYKEHRQIRNKMLKKITRQILIMRW